MQKKILIRYIILMAVLAICAAAAWRLAKEAGKSHADAVLVYQAGTAPDYGSIDEVKSGGQEGERTWAAKYYI